MTTNPFALARRRRIQLLAVGEAAQRARVAATRRGERAERLGELLPELRARVE